MCLLRLAQGRPGGFTAQLYHFQIHMLWQEHGKPGNQPHREEGLWTEFQLGNCNCIMMSHLDTQDVSHKINKPLADTHYHIIYREKFYQQTIIITIQHIETGKRIVHTYYRCWHQPWNQTMSTQYHWRPTCCSLSNPATYHPCSAFTTFTCTMDTHNMKQSVITYQEDVIQWQLKET